MEKHRLQLTLEQLNEIDAICSEFELTLRDRSDVRLEKYLEDVSPDIFAEVLEALLRIELSYRRRRGDRPTAHECIERFPGHRESVEAAFSASVPHVDSLETGAYHPTRIRDYRLTQLLGRGGMGDVFLAVHEMLKKNVALKVIRDQCSNPEQLKRFSREIAIVGQLEHPNIVRATDAGEEGNSPFLVMELLDGVDLETIRGATGKLRTQDACEIIRQAAHGLQHAHEQNLVHRDIKPSNIMLVQHEDPDQRATHARVKILDFGLSRLRELSPDTDMITQAHQIMGTADYMAPEQWSNTSKVDVRADVYSLGCTLYALLVGHAPFDIEEYSSWIEKMKAHQEVEVPSLPDEIPSELSDVVLRMLAKSPDDRPQTPAEIAELLAPFLEGQRTTMLLRHIPKREPVVAQSLLSTHTIAAPELNTKQSKKFSPRKTATLRWAMLCGLVIALGIIVYFNTGNGTVRLEISGPSEGVIVKVDGEKKLVIQLPGEKKPYKISVSPGTREIEVLAPDGTTIHSEKLVIRPRRKGPLIDIRVPEKTPPIQQTPVPKVADVKADGVLTVAKKVDAEFKTINDALAHCDDKTKTIEGDAEFRSINEALANYNADVKKIKVLDDEEYTESILLNKPFHQGLTLEGSGKTTLTVPESFTQPGLVWIQVNNVTFRGFRLKYPGDKRQMLVVLNGVSGGILEDLHVDGGGKGIDTICAISCEGMRSSLTKSPTIIRNCTFESVDHAIRISGIKLDYRSPFRCTGIAVHNCRFHRARFGVKFLGEVQESLVTNCVMQDCQCGVQIEQDFPETKRLLVCNNTMLGCECPFRSWSGAVRAKGLMILNNLCLDSDAVDWAVIKSEELLAVKGPGDAKAIHSNWVLAGNWREGKEPDPNHPRAAFWLAPGDLDVQKESMSEVVWSREPNNARFLEPAKNSPIVNSGHQPNELRIPEYIGAKAPQGAKPWDWQTTYEDLVK